MMYRLLLSLAFLLPVTGSALADETVTPLPPMVMITLKEVVALPLVLEAVKEQNTLYQNITEADIALLDRKWRSEVLDGGGPMTEHLLKTELSRRLMAVRNESDRLFTEVFVMDGKGLLVASSSMTSDFMQGDEPKWQKTITGKAESLFIEQQITDESSGTVVLQVSMPIYAAQNSQPIGTVTASVAAEKLGAN